MAAGGASLGRWDIHTANAAGRHLRDVKFAGLMLVCVCVGGGGTGLS
jgi:hypothetical protein